MGAGIYLERLRIKYGCSLKYIEKRTGIKYRTLSAYNTHKDRRPSMRFLDDFARLENIEKWEVVYLGEIYDDFSPLCTESVLMYLSKKYCENYSISYSDILTDYFDPTISYQFGGSFITKRTGANLTVVDDWDILVKDAWVNFFEKDLKKMDSKDYYKEVFPTKKNFYKTVLFYGTDRIRRIKERKIRNYHIVFSNLEDMQFFDQSDVNYGPFKLKLLHIEVPDKYKFDNVRFVDENLWR